MPGHVVFQRHLGGYHRDRARQVIGMTAMKVERRVREGGRHRPGTATVQPDERMGLAHGTRRERQPVEQLVDGQVHADAESEHGDGGQSKRRTSP
jgi:hypothetical protein